MRTRDEVAAWLRKFGYLESEKPNSSELDEAVREMQARYGLKEDALVGPVTNQAMGLFRCGVPDVMRIEVAGSTDCKWQSEEITYYHTINFRLPGMTREESAASIELAVKLWQQHIPLKMSRCRHKSDADILIFSASGPGSYFDGPGNTLAWSEMPCLKDDVQLKQAYDRAEPWTSNQIVRPGVLALAVMAHEMGHALGLDHSRQPGELMAPFYNPAVVKPTPGDIQRIQRLYGEPDDGAAFRTNVEGVLEVTEQGVGLDLRYVAP